MSCGCERQAFEVVGGYLNDKSQSNYRNKTMISGKMSFFRQVKFWDFKFKLLESCRWDANQWQSMAQSRACEATKEYVNKPERPRCAHA